MGRQNPATTISEEHPHASTNWEHHGTEPRAKAWHWLLEGHRLPSSSHPTGPQACPTAGKEPEAPSASCPKPQKCQWLLAPGFTPFPLSSKWVLGSWSASASSACPTHLPVRPSVLSLR